MAKLLYILGALDPRQILKDTWVSIRSGWKRAYEENTKHLLPIRMPWWKWPLWKLEAYVRGVDPRAMIFFAQGQFGLAEIEMIISSTPPELGPVLVTRVNVQVSTTIVPPTVATWPCAVLFAMGLTLAVFLLR